MLGLNTLITHDSDPILVEGVATYVYDWLRAEEPAWFVSLPTQPQLTLDYLRIVLDAWAAQDPESLEDLGSELGKEFESPDATDCSVEVAEGVADVIDLALWRRNHALPEDTPFRKRRGRPVAGVRLLVGRTVLDSSIIQERNRRA